MLLVISHFHVCSVRIKGSFDTDEIQAIAQAIIETCPLVPPTKLTEVEQLLYYLHTRKISTEDGKNIKFHHNNLIKKFVFNIKFIYKKTTIEAIISKAMFCIFILFYFLFIFC